MFHTWNLKRTGQRNPLGSESPSQKNAPPEQKIPRPMCADRPIRMLAEPFWAGPSTACQWPVHSPRSVRRRSPPAAEMDLRWGAEGPRCGRRNRSPWLGDLDPTSATRRLRARGQNAMVFGFGSTREGAWRAPPRLPYLAADRRRRGESVCVLSHH